MVKNVRKMTLSVHRAIVADTFPFTISQILIEIKEKSNKITSVVDQDLWTKAAISFPPFPKTNFGIASKLGLFEPGAQKSTISHPDPHSTYSTSQVSPPDESNFLNHQVCLFSHDNFVVSCGLGKRGSLLIDLIGKLAKTIDLEIPIGAISLTDLPNKISLQKIRDIGVKEVTFDAANLLGSLQMEPAGVISHLFRKTSSVKDLQLQGMIATVSVKSGSIFSGALQIKNQPKNEWLNKAAELTLSEKEIESYKIILNDNSEWPEGSLKLRKSVNVKSDGGSSYEVSDALSQMVEYFNELKNGGHLE